MAVDFFKKISLFLIIAANCSLFFAFELSDAHVGLSDALAEMLTGNEGQTAFRSFNIPMGGRSEAMGQAFTAICDDIGFIEQNPAGSVLLPDMQVAFFHNSWIADSAVDSLAFAMRLKDFGIGAALRCFYVPFTEYDKIGERLSSGYYSESSLALNCAYNFFSGYKFKGLAVGGNVKVAYRNIPDFANEAANKVEKKSGLSQSGVAVLADLGILLRFDVLKKFASREPNLTVGFSLMNVGIGWTNLADGNAKIDDPMPTTAKIGAAFRPTNSMIASVDASMPLNLTAMSKIEKPSFAAGYSIQFTKFWTFLCGLGVHGLNPRMSLGFELQVKKLKINANYTLDLASSINPFNHFSVGLKVFFEDHEKSLRRKQIDAIYNEGLRFYNEKNYEMARICWLEVLSIDPNYDPAIEGIRLIDEVKENYENISGGENALEGAKLENEDD